ncbi:MAG: Hpt domain-containing protein [Cellvibrionales bacterium]|jgi:two-component system chemotaxis sensor kinase CheA|nr:Hpt domain-containing protein [Cellvibrionales bacterium]HRF87383.1 Hpt domain-containing protein [Pseudomonadales bacterium]HRG50271.1 Hpt domain-containing protein [Pseudomonadales bacterium]
MKNNDLWQAFFTEVSEQLDNLEQILAANNAEAHADIHQLFRDFHTIKSSCAMMEFYSMEKVAHASEDYLDLVRKGRTALDASTINTLLEGIDWLKSQLQQMRNTGNTPPENSELVARLHELSQGFSTIAEPEEQDNNEESSPAGFFTEVQLSTDELHEFASACSEELVTGLTPSQDPAKVKRSLNKLVSISNLLGFTAIASLLRKYIKATNALDQGLAANLAAEILNRIALFENHYGVNCGTAILHTAYFDAMFVNFTQLSGRLDYLLDLIEENPDAADSLEAGESLLKHLTINAELFGHLQLATLFRYILQILRHIKRNEIPDKRTAFYAIRRAADISFTEEMQAGESSSAAQTLKNRIAELDDSIAQAMLGSISASTKQNLADSLSVAPAVIKNLSSKAVVDLDGALNTGKTISEVGIVADCSNEILESILSAIKTTSRIIHSYSIFHNRDENLTTKDQFVFIVIPEIDLSTLSSSIYTADPAKQFSSIRDIRLQKDNKTTQTTEKKSSTEPDIKLTPSSSATLRIESSTLENLMTQTGELLMAHNTLSHEIRDTSIEQAISKGKKWLSSYKNGAFTPSDMETMRSTLNTLQQAQNKISASHEKLRASLDAMQNRILDLRVIPIAAVFNRIPQLVQKMADTQGKKINLSVEGSDVRIDKGMVDILMEPLIHLVRNCIDHGIEPPSERNAAGKNDTAALVLSASQEGSTLLLEIADDGRGMNLSKIRESGIRKGFIQPSDVLTDQEICQLIFLPGFSTAETITETSGRGVGMDVVITRIQHIGGNIDVQTTQGAGTHFTMTLPLSAALQDVVIAQNNGNTYAVAQTRVLEVLSANDCIIQSIMGQSAILLRDTVIPLFYLEDLAMARGTRIDSHNQALRFQPINESATTPILILGQTKNKFGVCVDRIVGRENVFVRELHRDLRNIPSISGAAVRSNGELAFILNNNFLQQYAQNNALSWINRAEERIN